MRARRLPYAPGATGNVVTEDVVFLAESLGFDTGIDLEKLIAVRKIVPRRCRARHCYGQVAKAGLPKGFAVTPKPSQSGD